MQQTEVNEYNNNTTLSLLLYFSLFNPLPELRSFSEIEKSAQTIPSVLGIGSHQAGAPSGPRMFLLPVSEIGCRLSY